MYLATIGNIKLRDAFTPRTGVVKLLPSNIDGSTLAVLEPSVIVDTSDIKIYFTKCTGNSTNAICLATTTTVNGSWAINPTPIIGLGYGGAPASRQAHSSDVVKIGSFYYCAASNGYGFGAVGEDRNIYLYRSTDGINFIDLGLILDKTSIGVSGFGNVSINPNLINGKYEILVDASSGGIWKVFRFNTANIETEWTYRNDLPSLQVVEGAMYGGMCHRYVNGKWHILYHYGSAVGNLPTILGYATTTDLISVNLRETPMFGIETDPYGGGSTDQLADPCIFESQGKTYMLAEYCRNSSIFESQLWIWEYNGKMEDLLK
jgi:hypothetical protein